MGGQEEKFYRAWSGEGNPFFNVRFAGQTAPTFYDNDGDGDLDMSTLSLDRTVAYDYKNAGTAANPKYELELSVNFNEGTFREIDYEPTSFHRNITFTLTDTDGYDTLDVRTDISAQQIDMNPPAPVSAWSVLHTILSLV